MIPDFLHQMQVVAGHDVVAEISRRRRETVAPSTRVPGCLDSDTLIAHQVRIAGAGFLGAEIVRSSYGHSVRYDSGLQGFGLLAGSRSGTLDGSWEDAVRWATRWQAADPTRRYVWARPSAPISCGCCAGPEKDRCCCHMHQDISRGLRAKKCSRHRLRAEG